MNRTILALLAFMVSPVSAAEGLPKPLLGHWETDLSNCLRSFPDSGQQAWFDEEGAGGVVLYHLDDATPGGSCEILSVDAVGSQLILSASCWMEEGRSRPAHILASIDGDILSMQADWLEDATNFHRCPALERPTSFGSGDPNAPMDIGLGN